MENSPSSAHVPVCASGDEPLEPLLTAREIMDALKRLDVGRWDPSSMRQWTGEDEPCPIARQGEKGKGHLFSLRHVLTWLQGRDSPNINHPALRDALQRVSTSPQIVFALSHAKADAAVGAVDDALNELAEICRAVLELQRRVGKLLPPSFSDATRADQSRRLVRAALDRLLREVA